MLTGKVIAKLGGYGYIEAADFEADVFFHKSALRDCYFNKLQVGQEVGFIADHDNPKGVTALQVYTKNEGVLK